MIPSDQGMQRERRRYRRVSFAASVIVIRTDGVETLAARDLGAGGIFVYSATAPEVGTRVKIEFATGKSERFSVGGRVVRQERSQGAQQRAGFAVEFDLDERVRERLLRALSE